MTGLVERAGLTTEAGLAAGAGLATEDAGLVAEDAGLATRARRIAAAGRGTVGEWLVRAGLVTVRPARATDAAATEAFLTGLTLDSSYRRFFTGLGRPPAAFVRRFVDVDHDRRETLLALVGGTVIGMADYAIPDDRRTVELGIVIADAWQRLGLGPRLAEEILDRAVTRGATTLLVYALADNARVARILRRRWPGFRPIREDSALVWHLPLM